jgi:intracellular sulfur oxidation DsrE/DsrF family protein
VRVALLISSDARGGLALGTAWADAGDEVAVVLLDAAAGSARQGHRDEPVLGAALAAGVSVAALDDSLRRRGVGGDLLADGVKSTNLDEVADLVAEGAEKAVWL